MQQPTRPRVGSTPSPIISREERKSILKQTTEEEKNRNSLNIDNTGHTNYINFSTRKYSISGSGIGSGLGSPTSTDGRNRSGSGMGHGGRKRKSSVSSRVPCPSVEEERKREERKSSGNFKPTPISEIRRRLSNAVDHASIMKNKQLIFDTVSMDSEGNTPRTSFDEEEKKKVRQRIALLMKLDKPVLEMIKEEFEAMPDGLDLYEFAVVCLQALKVSDVDWDSHLEALIEIFREVDVNGDGTMEWDEFTSYLVEMANAYYYDQTSNIAEAYLYSPIEDNTTHDHPINHTKWLPGFDRLAVLERGSTRLKLYDEKLCHIKTLRGHRDHVMDVVYLSEQNMLASCGADSSICFWDTKVPSYDLLSRWQLPSAQASLCWNGMSLFSGDALGEVFVWSVERGERKGFMTGHTDTVLKLSYIPDMMRLVSASLDTSVRLWDATSCQSVMTLSGHKKPVYCIASAPSHQMLITGGLDNYALAWNPHMRKPLFTLKGLTPSSYFVGIESLNTTSELALADNSGNISIYDLRTLKQIQVIPPQKSQTEQLPVFSSLSANRYDNSLYLASDRLYQIKKKTPSKAMRAADDSITVAMYNKITMSFVTASGRTVKEWNALTGMLENEYIDITDSNITSMCLDHRQRRLFIGDHTGKILVINYSNGAKMKELDRHKSEVTELLYLDDATEVYSCSWDGTLVNHIDKMGARTTTERRVHDHTKDITCMSVSTEYGIVASGSLDTYVYVYDLHLGSYIGRCEFHEGGITSLCFIDHYPILIVGDDTGRICFWLLKPSDRRFYLLSYIDSDHIDTAPSITGLKYDMETYTLICTDSSGMWSCYNLSLMLGYIDRSLAKGSVKKVKSPAEIARERKRKQSVAFFLAVTGAEDINTNMSVRNAKLRDDTTPYTYNLLHKIRQGLGSKTQKLQPALQIQAHRDGICGLQVISTLKHTCVLTYGLDGAAHIWNLKSGEHLGSLLQGFNHSSTTPLCKWSFHPDILKRRRKIKKEVGQVKGEVNGRIETLEKERYTANGEELRGLTMRSRIAFKERKKKQEAFDSDTHMKQMTKILQNAHLHDSVRGDGDGGSGSERGSVREREEREREYVPRLSSSLFTKSAPSLDTRKNHFATSRKRREAALNIYGNRTQRLQKSSKATKVPMHRLVNFETKDDLTLSLSRFHIALSPSAKTAAERLQHSVDSCFPPI